MCQTWWQRMDVAFTVTLFMFRWIHAEKITCYCICTHRFEIVLKPRQQPQFFFHSFPPTLHISTTQSTVGMMWNVLIAAWMHHGAVSVDRPSPRSIYSTLLNPCFHEMAKKLLPCQTHTLCKYALYIWRPKLQLFFPTMHILPVIEMPARWQVPIDIKRCWKGGE